MDKKKRSMSNNETKDIILNSKIKDSGAKLIFGDNALCAEFIRDYVDIPFAKEVQAEDIEDVSEQFVPLFEEERDADVVKKIQIKGENPFFFISLFEHKTKVDYNVSMQIFRYMVFIWDAYEKEINKKQKNASKLADFKYPPIIPIVYYEGKQNWTVPLDFASRVRNGDIYRKYIPDFEYYFVPLKEYSNEKLIDKGDGISLLMMINKLQSLEDIEAFRKSGLERVGEIANDIPDYQRTIIANVLMTALLKMNMPVRDALGMVEKVEEKKMAELFECMEKIDIQAEWAKLDEARDALENERDALENERDALENERDVLNREKEALEQRKSELKVTAIEIEVSAYVSAMREIGISYEETLNRVIKKMNIEKSRAEELLEKLWD